jgi:hypothetical protein
LHQQLAGIRYLDLSDVSSVLAVMAFKPLFWKISNAHKATLLTNVNAIVVADIEQALFQETSSTMRDHAVTLHFSEPQATITRPSLGRLSSEYLSRPSSSRMNLVLNHVLESLIVSRTEKDHDFQFLATKAIVHDLIPPELVPLLMKCLGDFLNGGLSPLSHSLKRSGITLSASK